MQTDTHTHTYRKAPIIIVMCRVVLGKLWSMGGSNRCNCGKKQQKRAKSDPLEVELVEKWSKSGVKVAKSSKWLKSENLENAQKYEQ